MFTIILQIRTVDREVLNKCGQPMNFELLTEEIRAELALGLKKRRKQKYNFQKNCMCYLK